MANANAPYGLRPERYVSGAPYNGASNPYSIPTGDATALYPGDPVKLVGTAQTINGIIYPDIARAATGDVMVGVVTSVEPITQASTIYREASTQRIINVADDPNLLFAAQEVNSGTPLAANDIGLNIDFVVGSGSTVTGLSGTTLNNATEATTNTLDLKIFGFLNVPNNAIGAAAQWLVRINRHIYVNQIAGV